MYEMSMKEMDKQVKAKNETRERLKNARRHAGQEYKETKKQATIIYKKAKKIAVDKHVKKEADEARKEALKIVRQSI
jgi:hypothetical protein